MYSLDSSGKAVADGAAVWYIRRSVTGRATRFAYGINIISKYDPFNEMHKGREVVDLPAGDFVQGVWSPIVNKVKRLTSFFWMHR
jgi:hypothetical protein